MSIDVKKKGRGRRGNGEESLGRRNGRGSYIATYHDETGRRRERSTRTTDRAAAERILRKLLADAALRREGVVDAAQADAAAHARRPLDEHMQAFEETLNGRGRDAKHVASTLRYIRAARDAGGWATAGDIHADDVHMLAATLRRKGRSARTVAAHLTAAKQFTRWLTAGGKLARDPLATVAKPNASADRRRVRRMLRHDEWERLQAATLAGDRERRGMSAATRVLLYGLAIQTGLRAKELRSLRPTSLRLDATQPHVLCEAGSTKNRRRAKQHVRGDLAASLRQYAAERPAAGPLFDLPHETDMADLLRADVADARAAWLDEADDEADAAEHHRRQASDFLAEQDHAGGVLDFHALRHTCGAWLVQAGVNPKAVQRVMRHSTITLTMDT